MRAVPPGSATSTTPWRTRRSLKAPENLRRYQGTDNMPLVLIVEDNPINRDVLGRRLERRGYSVRFAEDGPTVIEAAARLTPDIILMDIGLGELIDGWEATTAHQSEPGNRRHPDCRADRQCFRIRSPQQPGSRLLRFRHQAGRPAALDLQDRAAASARAPRARSCKAFGDGAELGQA